jgi:hypothetical protein
MKQVFKSVQPFVWYRSGMNTLVPFLSGKEVFFFLTNVFDDFFIIFFARPEFLNWEIFGFFCFALTFRKR